MTALRVELFEGRPLLDIGSYARRGPGRRDRLTSAEIAQIARTVSRTPEVMVKVLTRNSTDIASVRRHLGYIGRHGDLELETDDGDAISGKTVGRTLMQDWNLMLEEHRRSEELTARDGRKPAKLVHKLMLSMPAGTPPNAVLNASRNFLREEFGLTHRYAFVLHTDEPHPHVHAVIKAVSEQGERLHIRKATLRRWRAEFARQLREQGVAANATDRAVRGQVAEAKQDPIYRAMNDQTRESTHMRAKLQQVAATLTQRSTADACGSNVLRSTRVAVRSGWHAISRLLDQERHPALARTVLRFVEDMPPPRTEHERIARQLRVRIHERAQERSRG